MPSDQPLGSDTETPWSVTVSAVAVAVAVADGAGVDLAAEPEAMADGLAGAEQAARTTHESDARAAGTAIESVAFTRV